MGFLLESPVEIVRFSHLHLSIPRGAVQPRLADNRLKQQNVDAETGSPVDREDIVRGYEIGKGQYLQLEDDELEKIEIESTHTIEIDSFVPRPEIDDRYPVSPYYIAPTDRVGQEAFAVIRDAIRDKGMVGLGRVVLTRREHVVMLEAFDKGLLATTLRYSYEVRDQGAYFEDIPELKLPTEMIQLASHIIELQGGPFRSEEIRGSLRDCARRTVEEETGGASDRIGSGGRSHSSTRDQSHGRAARKHRR